MTPYPQWNEKEWENEIRRHEHSVADFFQDLVYCLDLPIEQPYGLSGAADMPLDPVASGSKDALQQWISDHEDEDAEAAADYEPRRPVCFSCVDALDQLAVEWNCFCMKFLDRRLFAKSLGIACGFAKLLARSADFTEPDKDVPLALLITLGKRAVADLEDLVSRIDDFQKICGTYSHECDHFCDRLALIRDQLSDRLIEINSTPF